MIEPQGIRSEQDLVFDWIRKSNSVVNTTLSGLSVKYIDELWDEEGVGYEMISGKKIFTGSGYCVDASTGYGIALKDKFPFIKELNYLDGIPFALAPHTLLTFSVAGEKFFVDPTYGQITYQENDLKLGRLEDIQRAYQFEDLTYEDIRLMSFDPTVPSTIYDKKYILSSFKLGFLKRGTVFKSKDGDMVSIPESVSQALADLDIY